MVEKERDRREGWLQIPKDQRVALRRLHSMMGHCSNSALVRMLRASMADKKVIKAAAHFQCPSCNEIKKTDRPREVKPLRPDQQLRFNNEVSVDVFEVKDSIGARHSILSIVDVATHYHVVVRVGHGGVPSSKVCAEAMNLTWLTPFGAPKAVVADQGVHNRGKFSGLLRAHGVEIRQTGVQSPFQLGLGERHGGLIKEVMNRAIHSRQLQGAGVISSLCAEAGRTKNTMLNHGGYSPAQWVLGQTPDDVTSLISHSFDEHIEVHQNLIDLEENKTPQENFMMQLLIRQTAKEAFVHVDSCQKIRKAMLRKSVPLCGPYRVGNLINFCRRGKWYGPARVLAPQGTSSLWILHGGVTILVSETSCRPATAEEIYKKSVLELRPSRKRRYALVDDDEDFHGIDHIPFSEDGDAARHLRARYEGQSPYVEALDSAMPPGAISVEESGVAAIPVQPLLPADFGGAADDPEVLSPHGPEPEESIIHTPPPGLGTEDESLVPSPSLLSDRSGQPEIEETPGTSVAASEVASAHPGEEEDLPEGQERDFEQAPLTQALRQSPERLDGYPPRSHYVEDERKQVSKDDQMMAFLVSRQENTVKKKNKKYARKNAKTGAGEEVTFEKESPEVQEKMTAAREKEWTNWQNYTNGRWISEEEFQAMRKKDPSLKAIPTRWVEVNKSEPGEPAVMKSRIVVRGDLEDSSKMRTDSPTVSQVMIAITMILCACRDVALWAGDISAAFLQGSTMDRLLVLKMPRGLPGGAQGDYYVVSSTVYGTKDAPRGWYKNLHGTMLQKGFKPVPHECAAYSLVDDKGELAGLAIVHVDAFYGPEVR
eukprot:s912_g1.t1